MAKLNPYKNTANELVKVQKLGSLKKYLEANVKNPDVIKIIEMFVELKQHVAFDEGRKQGNFETAQTIKALFEVEDPEYHDASEGYIHY